MIRAVVVDDEPVARRGLIRLLRDESDVQVVGEATDGGDALEVLRRERPDVVFLDIQMPGLDGMAVAEALDRSAHGPLVVFVTAYSEHAVPAFELEAADYVLKPLDRDRVRQVVARVRLQLRRAALDEVETRIRVLQRFISPGDSGGEPDRLVVRNGGTVLFLDPTEADWIESTGNYVRVHIGAQQHLVRSTLSAMEGRLGRHGFLRISRSVLVNLARARQVRPGSGGTYTLVLENGERLPVSRRSVPALRRVIERFQ